MQSNFNQAAKVELLENPKYYLALTALFRNEERFLKEWIEFYKLMGVEHFYLINHLSEDNYINVLEPYINEGIIDLTHLIDEPTNIFEWNELQNAKYLQTIKLIKDKVEWLIIVDTDEFLYPIQEQNLTTVLKNYDNYATLSVNWRIFGSNNVQRIQDNELMIEKLFMRDHNFDLHVKSIVKPRYVEDFVNPHFAIVKPGYEQVTENYQLIDGARSLVPSNNILTINHYYNRDLDFFYSRKLSRVHLLEKSLSAEERDIKINKFIQNNEIYSSIYDDTILKFAPLLRARILKDQPDLLLSSSKIIELPHNNKIAYLPNNLVFIIDQKETPYSLKNGYGYEPSIAKKIMSFTKDNETYIEVGANYGEIALQMSIKLGKNGKVYAFEPNHNLFQYFSTSIFFNDITNIELENIEKPNLDSYFQNADIIRINLAENECNFLEGARNIIDASPNLRLFVKWQTNSAKCLSNLVEKGFILIDLLKFNEACSFFSYQQNYRLSIDNIFYNTEILVIKEETFYNYMRLYSDTPECMQLANTEMFTAAMDERLDEIKYTLTHGADIDHIHANSGTTVHWAAQEGLLKSAKLLIDAGANLEIRSVNDMTPLTISIEMNNLNMTKFLIEAGANIENPNGLGATPLYLAAYFGYDDILQLLLDNGANKDVQVAGMSAFYRALQNKHISTAQLLAGSIDSFCQQINSTEYEVKYADLCGETKIDT